MKIFTIFLFTFAPLAMIAQTVDYNKVIIPDRITNVSFDERLVQLAWRNHPSVKVAQQNVEIAETERSMAKWSWLDNIYGVGNLNEFTVAPASHERSIYYPRYNFGVRVSLGDFVQMPKKTKLATYRMVNANHVVNGQKLSIREEVLQSVERMKENYKIIKLRQFVKEEYYQMYKEAEKKFQTNEINLERLRAALQVYYSRSEDLIQAQSEFNQEKLNLEGFTGVRLEEIEGYTEFLARLDEEAKQDF
ncbi:TolC family protein [Ohtaekwangia sp.]|uniref:TolC family protein n=1 Tax=Ohtaekwangia sp. TaxID=2066019 RepID=UPI002F94D7FA